MQNLLDTGMLFLNGQRNAHMARAVTYLRGDAELDIAATIGRTVYDEATSSGVLQRVDGRDFLINAADLADLGEPKQGDRIVDGDDSWEVNSPAPGSPPWRYSDQFRRTMRVHCKALGVAAP